MSYGCFVVALLDHVDKVRDKELRIDKKRVTELLGPFAERVRYLKGDGVVFFKCKHFFGQTWDDDLNHIRKFVVGVFFVSKKIHDTCHTFLESRIRVELTVLMVWDLPLLLKSPIHALSSTHQF